MTSAHAVPRNPSGEHRSDSRASNRLGAATAALIAIAGLLTFLHGQDAVLADTQPPAGLPPTVSADPLPTTQINGVIWAQVVVGNYVYATGSFSQARPAGVAVGGPGTVARANLLSYNIATGNLVTSFNHTLNGQGRAIAASPDGRRIYVGGDFTTVDGIAHNRIAAFDVASGALVSSFSPNLNNTVRAVQVTSTTVYAGGTFSSANGSTRYRLASFTLAGGLTTWNPSPNNYVSAMTLSPDKTRVIVGGNFSVLAGTSAVGMGSVNATTGASLPWAANLTIQDSTSSAAIDTLTSDATRVYGAGYFFTTGGNFEGRFAADPATGVITWMNNCHGDSYSVYSTGTVLYSASHEHDCADIGSFPQDNSAVFTATHHFVAAEMTAPNGSVNRHPIYPGGNGSPHYTDFAGTPVSTQLDWYPTLTEGTYTGQFQAAWSVTGNSTYVAVGGEFPTVNGAAQQGLVRFAVASTAPNRVGPTAAPSLTPLVYSQSNGTARVAWQATWDRDNQNLTYSLFRDNGASAIYTATVASTFWDRPNIGFLDGGLAAGSSHTYRVSAADPYGNTLASATARVIVGSASPANYRAIVLGDGASHFWPLSDAAGSTVAQDFAGFSDVNLTGTIALGDIGPISGDASTAASFGGGETQPPTPVGARRPPPLVPNNTAATVGQFEPGADFTEEAWFKTTSTAGGAILNVGLFPNMDSAAVDKAIYLDAAGKLHFGVQNNTALQSIDSSGSYNDGVWHLVNATLAGASAALYVDGVQVASGTMTDDIAFPGYWRIGGDWLGGWPSAPTSFYLAGSIADAAIYPTALSATDISGHYTAGTGGAVVTNQPPAASFTAACTLLDCAVDGSASTDPDGSVVSYAWNFGDGATASGATASHSFAAANTYTITLTVTDDGGASSSTTRAVTATAPVINVLADDAFNRTVVNGFGTASPAGGAWTTTGSASRLSVAPGAASITLAAGSQAGAFLGSVSTSNIDIVTSFAMPTLPVSSNGYYFYVVARRISGSEQYLVRARVVSGTGQLRLSLSKYDGVAGTEVSLASEVVAGTIADGGVVHLHVQATGTNPTTLRAKAWVNATAEPTVWTLNVADSSALLQAAGSIGVQGYLSASVTNGPIAANIAGFTAKAP